MYILTASVIFVMSTQCYSASMGYSRWIVPSSHKGCQCYLCKKFEIPLTILQFFPEIESEKTWKSGFWAHMWTFSGNPYEKRDFCSNNLEIQDTISQKEVWKSNLLYGKGIFSGMAQYGENRIESMIQSYSVGSVICQIFFFLTCCFTLKNDRV